LHILLQVQIHLAFVVCCAAHSCKRGFAAARAKLLVHLFGSQETGVTPQDELLDLRYSLAGLRREQVEVHLEEDVLHGKVAGHGGNLKMLEG
jgi:hypothetical protein